MAVMAALVMMFLKVEVGMNRTLVSFLPSTHSVRLLYPITSPLNQSGFVRPGPARSLDSDLFFAKMKYEHGEKSLIKPGSENYRRVEEPHRPAILIVKLSPVGRCVIGCR